MPIRNNPKYMTETCDVCHGDGVWTVLVDKVMTDFPCPRCVALGFITPDIATAQFFDTSIVSTYQVMEATDQTEFGALSDSNKTAYRDAMSCGTVDLTDGTQIRAALWSMFDAQSTTRANLITLLGE